MKRFVVFALPVVLMLIAGPVFAQKGPGRGGDGRGPDGDRHGKMMDDRGRGGMIFGDPERLKEKLGLSDDQIDKIEAINEKYIDEHKALRDKIYPKMTDLRKLFKADNVDLAKIKTVLTEMSTLQTDARMLRIKQYLEIESVLTADQRKKIKRDREFLVEPGMMKGPMR